MFLCADLLEFDRNSDSILVCHEVMTCTVYISTIKVTIISIIKFLQEIEMKLSCVLSYETRVSLKI